MNSDEMSDILKKFNNMNGQNSISPDMINNLMGMLNNSSKSDTSSEPNTNSNNKFNFTKQANSSNNSGIDFDTILKMKTIIDKINVKDDPRSNLLQSLKPYLKDSRKSKIDQYIQLMNMSKVMDVFPFMGGESKK